MPLLRPVTEQAGKNEQKQPGPVQHGPAHLIIRQFQTARSVRIAKEPQGELVPQTQGPNSTVFRGFSGNSIFWGNAVFCSSIVLYLCRKAFFSPVKKSRRQIRHGSQPGRQPYGRPQAQQHGKQQHNKVGIIKTQQGAGKKARR